MYTNIINVLSTSLNQSNTMGTKFDKHDTVALCIRIYSVKFEKKKFHGIYSLCLGAYDMNIWYICLKLERTNINYRVPTFLQIRMAQSVEALSTNIKIEGSSPTFGNNFSFCILALSMCSTQVEWAFTNETKHCIQPRNVVIGTRENDNLKKKNMLTVLVPSTR